MQYIKLQSNCKFLPNVPLSDQDTGMMDRLSETSLEHLSLQTTLQEVLNLQAEYIIKLHLFLIQHANTDETTEKGITWS